jgi:hypothetical protein
MNSVPFSDVKREGGEIKAIMKYDEQLLLDFGNRFLGYGSLSSPLWLIGPEPGGGETPEEVYGRALLWSERDRKETEDLQGYHEGLKLFGIDWTRNIQPTWGCLIRIIKAFNGEPCSDLDTVRDFQRNELGRAEGENCLLELCPLSSPSEEHWNLADFGFSWTKYREDYEKYWIPRRIELLRSKIDKCGPRLVLFYGKRSWEQISKRSLLPTRLPGLMLASGRDKVFAAMPHPPQGLRSLKLHGRGAVIKYLNDVGTILREVMPNQ